MLVGDVRCATTGAGSSWKLSGGRKCSAATTKVSKNRHVRRAVTRSIRTVAAHGDIAPAVRTGTLIRCASQGDNVHRITSGVATGHAWGWRTATRTAVASAIPT